MGCDALSLLDFRTFMLNQNLFLLCRYAPENACTSSSTCDVIEVEPPPAKEACIFDELHYSETSCPQFKNTDQLTHLEKYSRGYASDSENSVKVLNNYIKNCKIQAKVLQLDCLLILLKKHCNGVFAQKVQTFESSSQAVRDLLWYVGPHYDKFKVREAIIPSFFDLLLPFNDPTRHKHELESLSKKIILKLASAVTSLFEKSFAYRASFSKLYYDKLAESDAKHANFLQQNQKLVNNYTFLYKQL